MRRKVNLRGEINLRGKKICSLVIEVRDNEPLAFAFRLPSLHKQVKIFCRKCPKGHFSQKTFIPLRSLHAVSSAIRDIFFKRGKAC